MPHDPEAVGRELAEALIDSLEQLKRRVTAGEDTPVTQAQAAQLALNALKALLPTVTNELGTSPGDPTAPQPFAFEVELPPAAAAAPFGFDLP